MKRTVNKKAILITLGIIAGIGLLYFGGFELTRIHNWIFDSPYSSRYIDAIGNSFYIFFIICVVGFVSIMGYQLFNWLFPKKEETK